MGQKDLKNITHGDQDLTEKQFRFAMAYLQEANAKKAAVAAGYSEKTAHVQGSRLLSNAKIQSFLSLQKEQAIQKAGISMDKVIKEMASVGLVRLSDIMTWDQHGNVTMTPSDQLTPEQSAAISKVTALTKLGEWMGIAPDNLPSSVVVNIQANDGSKIAVQLNQVVEDYGEALAQAVDIVQGAQKGNEDAQSGNEEEVTTEPVPNVQEQPE
jgi:phage terminase small subunit